MKNYETTVTMEIEISEKEIEQLLNDIENALNEISPKPLLTFDSVAQVVSDWYVTCWSNDGYINVNIVDLDDHGEFVNMLFEELKNREVFNNGN